MRLFSLVLLAVTAGAWAGEILTLAGALAQPKFHGELRGGDALTVSIENRSDTPVTVAQPAGLICASTSGEDRVITMRAIQIDVPAHQSAETAIPCAAISSRQPAREGRRRLTTDAEPRLAGLLDYFARHNDVPRLTAQLLVLCVTEDIAFAAWRRFLGTEPGSEPSSQEIVAGVDALGVLREVCPSRTFALGADAELKLRALRNPVARGKAMQLYGLALPDAPLPPDLGTLLHRKPGDNCPICRQRALMLPREDGL